MPNDYTTISEVKTELIDTNWTTAYDTLLTTVITDASRAIDTFTGREPGAYSVSSDTTRYFDGSGCSEQWIGELAALPTTISVAETGVVDNAAGTGGTYTVYTTSDYFPWPDNALTERRPILRLDLDLLNGSKYVWYKFRRSVKIVGKFGYTTTANLPPEIKRATKIQAIRWFKRDQQAYQDVGAIVELGQLRYVQALDPDIAETINHFRKVTI